MQAIVCIIGCGAPTISVVKITDVGRLTNKYSLNDFYLQSVPIVVGQATNNGDSTFLTLILEISA